jgi:hypothetical protein
MTFTFFDHIFLSIETYPTPSENTYGIRWLAGPVSHWLLENIHKLANN